jgi:hypothetical protein
MSFALAVGTAASIASTYAAALPFTAASNAAQTVLTMASTTGLAVGDYVEVTSGWSLLDGRLARISALIASVSITLELVDTTSTTQYPAGGGAGSVRKITAWTQLSQLSSNIQVSGGDQQYADITTLADRTQRQIPTVRSAVQITLPYFFDQALSWISPVRAVSDSAAATGVMLAYPGGSRTVGNAFWSLRDVPSIEDSTLRGEVALSFSSKPITYAT